MIKKIGGQFSLRAALFGVGFLFSLESSNATEAIVRAVRGQPKYVNTNGFPVVIRKGEKLPAGVTIRTGMGESVDIAIGERGRLVSVAPNSRLKIDPTDNSISLEKGELVGSFRNLPDAPELRPVTLRTPTGISQVSVGDISVNADQGTHSLLSGRNVTFQAIGASGVPEAPMNLQAGRAVTRQNSQAVMASMSEALTANLMARVDTLVSQQRTLAEDFRKTSSYTTPTTTQASPEPEPEPTNPGTGTPGYWFNHPESWPITSIVVGGVTYSQEAAIAAMRVNSSRDVTYSMFQALVAARLNVLIGNQGSCIAAALAAADTWLATNPLGSKVSGSSTAWTAQGEAVKNTLDSYNNGLLCAPSRG